MQLLALHTYMQCRTGLNSQHVVFCSFNYPWYKMNGISLNQSCERDGRTKLTFQQNRLSHLKLISQSDYFPQVLGTSLHLEHKNVWATTNRLNLLKS